MAVGAAVADVGAETMITDMVAMKTTFSFQESPRAVQGVTIERLCSWESLALALYSRAPANRFSARRSPPESLATPQQAVAALNSAVNATNQAAFDLVFGPARQRAGKSRYHSGCTRTCGVRRCVQHNKPVGSARQRPA